MATKRGRAALAVCTHLVAVQVTVFVDSQPIVLPYVTVRDPVAWRLSRNVPIRDKARTLEPLDVVNEPSLAIGALRDEEFVRFPSQGASYII